MMEKYLNMIDRENMEIYERNITENSLYLFRFSKQYDGEIMGDQGRGKHFNIGGAILSKKN